MRTGWMGQIGLLREWIFAALVWFVSTACLSSALAATPRPCDLFAGATPCVAAISTTRTLYQSYRGPLYQVTRQRDGKSQDIGALADGYADAARVDAFCGTSACFVTRLYDQSPNHNDLLPAPPGGAAKGPGSNGFDLPSHARLLSAIVGGHKVFGILVNPGTGYRNDHTRNVPTHGHAEGVYMVTSAEHLNTRCCFDFGNAETNNLDNDAGHMDAINIRCANDGVCRANAGLDMENGIFGQLPVSDGTMFVTVMGANDGQHTFRIYQGDAQGGALTTTGALPLHPKYKPMRQEGAVILGIGGDNSNSATGCFFEGAMTSGMPDEAAMRAVHLNIVMARYSHLQAPNEPGANP